MTNFLDMKMKEELLDKVINFRHLLHRYPDTSNNEKDTALRIINFLKKYNPDKIINNVGGYGVIVIFKGKATGPELLFRADLDAVNISENNDLEYQSSKENISHMCGHDGHMAILSGFGAFISDKRKFYSKITLLFQPAEEIGMGAKNVIKDSSFSKLDPEYVFAYHNIPEYKKSKILLKKGVFAKASVGMIIKFSGKTAHAAEPEKANSPEKVLTDFIFKYKKMRKKIIQKNKSSMITLVHLQMGDKNFGITPGNAEIYLTIRADKDFILKEIISKIKKLVSEIINTKKFQVKYEYKEKFLSTHNDRGVIRDLRYICKKKDFDFQKLNNSFSWSEDFGVFLNNYKGVLIGIGSGANQPNLHNPYYDFPDSIIETGINFFWEIVKYYQKKQS